MIARNPQVPAPLQLVGLFAGIGGIELGLHRAGFRSVLLCEIDEAADRVLAARFPGVPRVSDIRTIAALPEGTDIVTAGFPCQDLSQAGKTAGIRGSRSGLVGEVFRLLDQCRVPPRWLLLENVRFMLSLEQGRAMTFLTDQLTSLGYRWAYRVVDSRAFGLPQRRQRVLLLASRTEDPRGPLLGQDRGGEESRARPPGVACGFYWTEGVRGLGWAVDAVPTLKGGSTIGIPSPPAIWTPDGRVVTPDIRDAERLQGFPAGWTRPALAGPAAREGVRWKLVGNAVSVPLSTWLGRRVLSATPYESVDDPPLRWDQPWPDAAWNIGGGPHKASASMYPVQHRRRPLADFLRHPSKPLSAKAARGFLSRARRSRLRFPEGLLAVVERHVEAIEVG
jgi:DNA (cytosine-5)-methyltransferase 1